MMRSRSRLLKAQHFAEDEGRGTAYQPFRASGLQTALEVQSQERWNSESGRPPEFMAKRQLMPDGSAKSNRTR